MLPQNPSQIDKSVVALIHGIKTSEGTNGDYNSIGDRGTAAGIAQWSNQIDGIPQSVQKGQVPLNFSNEAKKYGLDPTDFSPENQNKVLYNSVATDKKNGLSPEQILSKWNSGDPNKYLNQATSTGTGSVGAYDVSSYVKRGMKAAQEYSQKNRNAQSGVDSNDLSNAASIDTAQTQPKDESLLGKAWDVAKGVGNFLFPIVGDVYHDIKGDNKKTFLQQVGDTALSALPFVPGLGEAGEAVRGGEAVAEGGSALAKSGLVSKFLASPVAKGAVTGYGAGVASNLSQGQGLGEAFTPNANTLLGAGLGAAAPAVLKGASGLLEKASGIAPQVKTELANIGLQGNAEDVKLYNQYMNAAKEHAVNGRATAPLVLAGDSVDKAANIVSDNTAKAGADVGKAKLASANIPLQPLNDVGKAFSSHVGKEFGLTLSSDENGRVIATPKQGSFRDISPADKTRIEKMATYINKLHAAKGNVAQASDIIDNLNELVDFSKQDIYGHTNDPLESLIKDTAGNLNSVIRETSPSLASANDRFSGLKDLQKEIKSMAGKNLNKGELLMKRVFSGDKSGDVQDFFGKLQQETGMDLYKHATLARHAIQTVGSPEEMSLLQQAIKGGTQAASGKGITPFLMDLGSSALKKVSNPERMGRRLVQGKSSGLLRNLATKGAIEASRLR